VLSDYVLNAVLVLLVLAIVASFWHYHRSGNYEQFNLLDLVTTRDGRIHRPAVMEFGAFVLMTWGFIVLINRDNLAEWYATIYVGAFVLRAAYSAWLRQKTDQQDANREDRPYRWQPRDRPIR